MPPAKEVSKRAHEVEISNTENGSKPESSEHSLNSQHECETDNDEKPLQIDTGSEAKSENVECAAKEEKHGNKRGADNSVNPTPTKKARPKPKPMKIENMKEYVDSNTIEKLTTTTLFHWLKERNLHCSTRDKKADLIQKIKNQFVTTSS